METSITFDSPEEANAFMIGLRLGQEFKSSIRDAEPDREEAGVVNLDISDKRWLDFLKRRDELIADHIGTPQA